MDLASFDDEDLAVAEYPGGPIIQLSESQAEDAVRAAMSRWSTVIGANLSYQFNAPPSAHATASNLDVVIGMGQVPGALASHEPDPITETNMTSNIEVYSAYSDEFGRVFDIVYSLSQSGPDEVTLTDVLAHELGHAVGFSHSDDSSSIMWFSIEPAGQYFVTAADEDGLRFIY